MQIIGDVPQLTAAGNGKSTFILWEIALISVCRFGEYMQYWGKIIGVAVALLMGGGFGA